MKHIVQRLKRKAPSWVWMASLVLLGTALYGPFLNAPFSLDDYNLLLDDIHLKNPKQWLDYFYPTDPAGTFSDAGPQHSAYYRPFAHFIPFLIHRLAGPRPWVFRSINLGVFLLGCAGFGLVLRRLGLNEWASFTAAAVMALHPHNTIAVNYIPGAFAWQWMFSVLMLWGLSACQGGIKRAVLVVTGGVGALLCHESALALLPIGVVVMLWAGGDRRRVLVFVLVTIVVLCVYKIIKPYQDAFIPLWLDWLREEPWAYLKGLASVFLLHAKWLFLGRDVVLMGVVPFKETVSGPVAAAVLCAMAAAVATAVWAVGRRIIWGWFVLWYAAGFSIVALGMLSYPRKGWIVEAHWLIPAAAAYAGCCGLAVETLKRRRFLLGSVSGILLLLFYAVQAQQINRLWSQEPLYLAYWHRLQPSHALVMFFLGDYYLSDNDCERAVHWYEKGLLLEPDNIEALNNLALCALMRNDPAKAKALFEEVVRLKPSATALNNLAVFYFKELNRPDDAVSLWKKAAAEDPKALPVRCNLARTLLDRGRPEEALQWLQQNLTVAPEDVTTRMLLLEAQLILRRPEASATAAWLVDRIRSSDGLIRLGVLLDETGHGRWARRFFERAIERDPANSKGYEALGVWAANRGLLDAAERIWSVGKEYTAAQDRFDDLLRRLKALRSSGDERSPAIRIDPR